MRQVTLASQGRSEKCGRKSQREQFLVTMNGMVP